MRAYIEFLVSDFKECMSQYWTLFGILALMMCGAIWYVSGSFGLGLVTGFSFFFVLLPLYGITLEYIFE